MLNHGHVSGKSNTCDSNCIASWGLFACQYGKQCQTLEGNLAMLIVVSPACCRISKTATLTKYPCKPEKTNNILYTLHKTIRFKLASIVLDLRALDETMVLPIYELAARSQIIWLLGLTLASSSLVECRSNSSAGVMLLQFSLTLQCAAANRKRAK